MSHKKISYENSRTRIKNELDLKPSWKDGIKLGNFQQANYDPRHDHLPDAH